MKRSAVFLFISCICTFLHAQNPPVTEKGAPQSNNTLPSGGTLGSNSGVNPMGNPGTIINNAGNNTSNNTLAPHPNIESGTRLTSSPEGTVVTTTVTSGTAVQKTAVASTPAGTVKATVVDTSATRNNTAVVNTAATTPREHPKKSAPPVVTAEVAAKPLIKDNKSIPAYSPVLGNYVPEQTINKIKSKYGTSVYDVRTVRIASNNKIAYIVRIVENGQFKSELFYDEP